MGRQFLNDEQKQFIRDRYNSVKNVRPDITDQAIYDELSVDFRHEFGFDVSQYQFNYHKRRRDAHPVGAQSPFLNHSIYRVQGKKLDHDDVAMIRALLHHNIKIDEIATEYEVSPGHIKKIDTKERWPYIKPKDIVHTIDEIHRHWLRSVSMGDIEENDQIDEIVDIIACPKILVKAVFNGWLDVESNNKTDDPDMPPVAEAIPNKIYDENVLTSDDDNDANYEKAAHDEHDEHDEIKILRKMMICWTRLRPHLPHDNADARQTLKELNELETRYLETMLSRR